MQRTRVSEDRFLCFGGRHHPKQTLVIQIVAISLTSDNSITIVRFRSSKLYTPFWALLFVLSLSLWLASSLGMPKQMSGRFEQGVSRQGEKPFA